jgi:hypothetical protein
VVAFALKARESRWLDGLSLAALVLLVTLVSYLMSARAGARNKKASETLQSRIHWEATIKALDRPMTFKALVLTFYIVLGSSVFVFGVWEVATHRVHAGLVNVGLVLVSGWFISRAGALRATQASSNSTTAAPREVPAPGR